jgi:hypothetical protein
MGKIEEMNLKDLAELQKDLNNAVKAVEVAKVALNKLHDYIRKDVIPEKLENAGMKSVTYENIGRVTITEDAYTQVVSGKLDEALQWLSDNGHAALVKNNVHHSSLKALLKEKLKKGEDIPEDIFKVTPYSYTKINKIN